MTSNPPTGARALALMAALFAVTLNFLQPLAHAALMRDGAPGALWSAFCNSVAAQPDRDIAGKATPVPVAAQDHECCLGLADAPALALPSNAFVSLPPILATLFPSLPAEQFASGGIRDGPSQPRGPPSLA